MKSGKANAFQGLCWPIKASFARYVASLPDGRAELAGPISASKEWGLIFSLADSSEFDATRGAGILKFAGGIRFQGHFGMLQIAIADPWLAMASDHGTVSIDAGSGNRIQFASFGLVWEHGHPYARGEEVLLDAAAVQLFGDVYGAGTLLDSFLFSTGETVAGS